MKAVDSTDTATGLVSQELSALAFESNGMNRQLLVPMDDSETARRALEHALAIFADDEITVVHVVGDLEAAYGGGPVVPESGDTEPAFFDDVREIASRHDRNVEIVTVEGTAPEAILEYAREENVDAIVMGSEGRSGVSRMLLGSVAEAVTRRSSVPVTIVPRS
ncbi:UspA domain-containing protein [Natronobacterium gregoryi SP2]|uniref:UspA domain-containing protein n=1 Tax=Natronobacterium gregoryi (strain ATCC 43098 / DSM 3393 / CCM 3738 / CIP 104747 / IAM 13177 / JCM 8860 / NBRC 102187 / NCIMB 2189 / SP2) TaxID=797304 RepID=L9Y7Q6_NATGS|nr:UspA domain-containing protein [Natronobacterium gregoryi SP2]